MGTTDVVHGTDSRDRAAASFFFDVSIYLCLLGIRKEARIDPPPFGSPEENDTLWLSLGKSSTYMHACMHAEVRFLKIRCLLGSNDQTTK